MTTLYIWKEAALAVDKECLAKQRMDLFMCAICLIITINGFMHCEACFQYCTTTIMNIK